MGTRVCTRARLRRANKLMVYTRMDTHARMHSNTQMRSSSKLQWQPRADDDNDDDGGGNQYIIQ